MAETGDRSKAQQLHERIFRVVRQIPAGQAATYGQVAMVAGLPSARMVGRALAALPDKSEVPWHRVINSQGKLAPRS
ncbi:MAG: MGMT family protein, partial [Planctomycetota bacterium]